MEEYLEQIAELLEEETVNPTAAFISFDAWDSLTSLSIIAFVDDEYGVNLSANDILEAKTIEGLYQFIKSKK